MKITFIGHAGLALQTDDCTILMDPWLSGAIFNDGWDLLVPSVLPETTLGQVTHVWISHEHPDHFHLPSLRTILKAHPNTLTILFQPTADSRVVNWARREGFEVQTLTEHCWVPLTESCRVLLGKVGLYDSWLAVEHGDKRFLNLNDCVFANEQFCLRQRTIVLPSANKCVFANEHLCSRPRAVVSSPATRCVFANDQVCLRQRTGLSSPTNGCVLANERLCFHQ